MFTYSPTSGPVLGIIVLLISILTTVIVKGK